MTDRFNRVAEEYLRLQSPGPRRNVSVAHILCPSPLLLEAAGAYSLPEADEIVKAEVTDTFDELSEFIEWWDPQAWQKVEVLRAGHELPFSKFPRIQPLKAVELPSPDSRGRTSIEAHVRLGRKYTSATLGFTALGGSNMPRRLNPAIKLDTPFTITHPREPRTEAQARSMWAFRQADYDQAQRFRTVLRALTAAAEEQLAA